MAWVLIDDALNWVGEWDINTAYYQYDTVLYQTDDGEEWHAFTCKTTHTTGQVSTISPEHWRRVYQEQLL